MQTQPKDNNPEQKNTDIKKIKGVKNILERSLESYHKLPMLEIIFEKFTKNLSTALRNLTSEAININIVDVQSQRFTPYLQTLKNLYSIVVFKAIEWKNFGLLVLENNMLFTFFDLLLGGKKNLSSNSDNEKILSRNLSVIEQSITRQISEVILKELSQAFDKVSPSTFSVERVENNPNFITIAQPSDAIIILRLSVEIYSQKKEFTVVIPYKAIDPIKEQMQTIFLGDKFGKNTEWEKLLIQGLNKVDFRIEAIITNTISTIKNVAKLKIGDTIMMDHDKNKDVTIRSGHVNLFKAKVGKINNQIAVSLTTFI